MLVEASILGFGIVVGYILGSPTEIETEKTVEKHITTSRVDVSGSVHSRGETTIDSIEADEMNMRVKGSVHERGTVNVSEASGE